MGVDGQLATLGAADLALDADDVAKVDHRQKRTGFFRVVSLWEKIWILPEASWMSMNMPELREE